MSENLIKRALKKCRLPAALLVASNAVFAQCPMCRRALVYSAEGQRLARGFNAGILFLLIVPLLLFGTITFLMYEARRRQVSRAALPQGQMAARSEIPALPSPTGG